MRRLLFVNLRAAGIAVARCAVLLAPGATREPPPPSISSTRPTE